MGQKEGEAVNSVPRGKKDKQWRSQGYCDVSERLSTTREQGDRGITVVDHQMEQSSVTDILKKRNNAIQ